MLARRSKRRADMAATAADCERDIEARRRAFVALEGEVGWPEAWARAHQWWLRYRGTEVAIGRCRAMFMEQGG